MVELAVKTSEQNEVPMDRGTDDILLQDWIRARDADAFNELTRRYSGIVFGTCLRITGNRAEAEDATQECFEILARIPEAPRTPLGAWLHRVATNGALDRVKAQKRRVIEAEAEAAAIKIEAEAQADAYRKIAEQIGKGNAALIEMLKIVGERAISITPRVMVTGGRNASATDGEMTALIGTMLDTMLQKTPDKENR